jgi:hypothetical protein
VNGVRQDCNFWLPSGANPAFIRRGKVSKISEVLAARAAVDGADIFRLQRHAIISAFIHGI